ncbi:MAG: helix-turn-helix domain-containing protein [Pirellulales bacterium]|nr:helix-turn-helix domain-containing protein [Pirellulales bacterium]
MLYQRSLEIERRLEAVLALVRAGGYSTPMIADELGVSVPTVSRAICALKERGHSIRSEKQSEGWSYVLDEPDTAFSQRELAEARQ